MERGRFPLSNGVSIDITGNPRGKLYPRLRGRLSTLKWKLRACGHVQACVRAIGVRAALPQRDAQRRLPFPCHACARPGARGAWARARATAPRATSTERLPRTSLRRCVSIKINRDLYRGSNSEGRQGSHSHNRATSAATVLPCC